MTAFKKVISGSVSCLELPLHVYLLQSGLRSERIGQNNSWILMLVHNWFTNDRWQFKAKLDLSRQETKGHNAFMN